MTTHTKHYYMQGDIPLTPPTRTTNTTYYWDIDNTTLAAEQGTYQVEMYVGGDIYTTLDAKTAYTTGRTTYMAEPTTTTGPARMGVALCSAATFAARREDRED